uniref:Hemerythrin-like domain-containing protein n=1 Tax=Chromera velia CCMP2878 TaxID=1169474 RepID=A0A0G4GPW5_9ALVE|eukprot:Cvel_22868.t1-p1 / transcript=Cvel_22868.t1 / gene=Cvel_22868 / organism=Chromera_velia_CCMP2878 / gene_product=hypothetical protein / transcript_product=hypothetical protein / location=Cvel_scaffold2295:13305-21108(-) / protein_length=630 / sequence_SO=supercontig / SO=protein_coding / is_pseudo=false
MGNACMSPKPDTAALTQPAVVVTPPSVSSSDPTAHLVFVNGCCCPASAMLKLMLHFKQIPFQEVYTSIGSKDDFLLRVSPDGSVPALGWLDDPSTDAKENVKPIPGLNDSKSPNVKEFAQWLDQKYPGKPLMMMPDHPKWAETAPLLQKLADSFPMICMAPKPPIQKEKRAKAVAALQKLNEILNTSGGATLLGTPTPTLLDAQLIAWLHRYPIMVVQVHWRSWTPETKPGEFSEVDVPSRSESTLPFIAAFREKKLLETGAMLASKEELLEFAEKRVKRPSPMGAGRLQHQSFRFWMKETVKKLKEWEANPSDQTLASVCAAYWGNFNVFMDAHSKMEDEIIYPEFEKQQPGSTQGSSTEHEHELPLLRASAEKVKALKETENRTTEQVREIREEIEKLCEQFEHHLAGEEQNLFPILESLPEEVHFEIFPRALASCEAERSEIYGFVLAGMCLSEQVQYWRNIIDRGQVDQEAWRKMKGYMSAPVGGLGGVPFLSEERVKRIVSRVPELQSLFKMDDRETGGEEKKSLFPPLMDEWMFERYQRRCFVKWDGLAAYQAIADDNSKRLWEIDQILSMLKSAPDEKQAVGRVVNKWYAGGIQDANSQNDSKEYLKQVWEAVRSNRSVPIQM